MTEESGMQMEETRSPGSAAACACHRCDRRRRNALVEETLARFLELTAEVERFRALSRRCWH
ncbi:MAG: hypothetical protein R3A10_11390 [Caldilineaceae bacterium]